MAATQRPHYLPFFHQYRLFSLLTSLYLVFGICNFSCLMCHTSCNYGLMAHSQTSHLLLLHNLTAHPSPPAGISWSMSDFLSMSTTSLSCSLPGFSVQNSKSFLQIELFISLIVSCCLTVTVFQIFLVISDSLLLKLHFMIPFFKTFWTFYESLFHICTWKSQYWSLGGSNLLLSSSGCLVVLLSSCLLSRQQSLTKLGVIFPWGIRVSSPGMRTTPVPGSLLVSFRSQFNEEASDSAPTTALTWPFAQEAPAERLWKTSCLLWATMH